MRLILARALGVLLGALAFALLREVIDAFGYTQRVQEITLRVLQVVTAPFAAIAAYWLWRRDQRAIRLTAIACGLGSVTGTFAAWTYAPPTEKTSALFGALGGGVVFTIVMVLLARFALKPATPEPVNPQI